MKFLVNQWLDFDEIALFGEFIILTPNDEFKHVVKSYKANMKEVALLVSL